MENNSASTEFKQLIAKGKEQGYLTIDEINDLIPPDIISGDQLSVFIQTFSDMGITVCETPPEADDILINGTSQPDNEDVDIVANQLENSVDIGRTTDPVRMYMREMGNVSLLQQSQEIEISQRIEKGTSEVQMCLVEYPQAMEELFARYEKTLDPESEIKLGDIINGFVTPGEENDSDGSFVIDEKAEEELAKMDRMEDIDDEIDVEIVAPKSSKKSKKDDVKVDEDDDDALDDADDSGESPNDSGPDPEEAKSALPNLEFSLTSLLLQDRSQLLTRNT